MRDDEANRFSARAARYARVAADIAGGDAAARRLSLGAALEALIWQAADPAQLESLIAEWTAAEKPTIMTPADFRKSRREGSR